MRLMEDCLVDQLFNDINFYLCSHTNNSNDYYNGCTSPSNLSTSLSPHTLRLLIYAVGKTHSVRAARLALMFSSILSHNLHADSTCIAHDNDNNDNINNDINKDGGRSSDNNDTIAKQKYTLLIEV